MLIDGSEMHGDTSAATLDLAELGQSDSSIRALSNWSAADWECILKGSICESVGKLSFSVPSACEDLSVGASSSVVASCFFVMLNQLITVDAGVPDVSAAAAAGSAGGFTLRGAGADGVDKAVQDMAGDLGGDGALEAAVEIGGEDARDTAAEVGTDVVHEVHADAEVLTDDWVADCPLFRLAVVECLFSF
mmetsp:Transcript_151461/g.282356  ORF Transcript_151461/g.282356 Transcript_151461/m.282356 type:complete len:191 (+) Transcript_151461:1616-2188(+)